MWTCETVALELPAYAHGSADAAVTAPVERHLKSCTHCQYELKQLQKLDTLLTRHFLEEQMPSIRPSATFASTFANRLAAEIMAEETAESRWAGIVGWLSRPWLLPAGAAAVLAVIVLGTMPGTTPGPVAKAPAPEKASKVAEAPARAPAKAPVLASQRAEKLAPEVATLPEDLIQRPDLFVDYSVIEQLDLDGAESAG